MHLGGTLGEIAAAEAAVAAAGIPRRPYVLAVQPCVADPSRAPAGQHVLWAYCHVPNGSPVDMTAAIEDQVERFAPGFRDLILARSAHVPADLERHNPNLVGGDIGGGSAAFRSFCAARGIAPAVGDAAARGLPVLGGHPARRGRARHGRLPRRAPGPGRLPSRPLVRRPRNRVLAGADVDVSGHKYGNHVQLRYNYRLYPDGPQREALARAFGCARVVFNDALAARRAAHAAGEPYIPDAAMSAALTAAKQTPERAWLREVSSVVLQQALADLYVAYRNFFASVTGKRKGPKVAPPRFRSRKDRRQAVRFTANSRFRVLGDGRLRLPMIGDVEVRWSRDVQAVPTSVTVIRDAADGTSRLSWSRPAGGGCPRRAGNAGSTSA